MGIKKPRQPEKHKAPLTFWDHALGGVATALVLLVPFFPDEKLIRHKLQIFEYLSLLFILLSGLRLILARHPRMSLSGIHVPLTHDQNMDSRLRGNDGQTAFAGMTNFSGMTTFHLQLLIFLWAGLSLFLWSHTDMRDLATPELRRLLFGAALFLSFSYGKLSSFWLKVFLVGNSIAGGLLSLYGILQRSGGVGTLQVPQMDRVMGTYGNPIMFASYLLAAIPLTAAAAGSTKNTVGRFMLFMALILETSALMLTQTRAAWIALVGSITLLLLFHGKLKRIPLWAYVSTALGLGIFLFATQHIWNRDQAHLLIWRDTVRLWKTHPFFGVGLGSFHIYFPDVAGADLKAKWPAGHFIVNYAHNEYLQLLAEGGIFFLLIFMGIIISFFRLIHSPSENDLPEHKKTLMFIEMAVLCLLIQNIFSVDMRFGISWGLVFLLMGLGVSLKEAALSDVRIIPPSRFRIPLQAVASLCWGFLVIGILFPVVRRPYLAQEFVRDTKDFFDVRLLDPIKTIDEMEALKNKYPGEPAVLERLAYFYAKEMMTSNRQINAPMAKKALQTYEDLIRLDPKRAAAYNNYGNVLYTVGHVPEALINWEKATELDPAFLDAHLNLGKVFYTRGELKKSAEHFKAVLKLNPNHSEAIVYLKKMVE